MSVTSRRALAMPAIVAIAGFTATGPFDGTGTAGSRLACLPVVW